MRLTSGQEREILSALADFIIAARTPNSHGFETTTGGSRLLNLAADNMMKAQKHFCKALSFLDLGLGPHGESLLRRAIREAEREENELLLCSALTRLGELLVKSGRGREAEQLLNRVLESNHHNDALLMEVERARELLAMSLEHA